MTNWFNYGVEMAKEFCNGINEYALQGTQYIAEMEGISGTPAEGEFLVGWRTIVSASGDVECSSLGYNPI